jgi:[ribosomal protein S5]-alanine N-acetyltransferase
MISTQRLHIIPLRYDQLKMYLQANDLLEAELGLRKTGRTISKEVKQRVERFILPKIKASTEDHFIFDTFWIVVEKSSRVIVSELGFKGPPNGEGVVEIGYGTMPGHEGNGYMTEAVAGVIEWAKERKDLNMIMASVDENNLASIRIVQKTNFEALGKKEDLLWWRKQVHAS